MTIKKLAFWTDFHGYSSLRRPLFPHSSLTLFSPFLQSYLTLPSPSPHPPHTCLLHYTSPTYYKFISSLSCLKYAVKQITLKFHLPHLFSDRFLLIRHMWRTNIETNLYLAHKIDKKTHYLRVSPVCRHSISFDMYIFFYGSPSSNIIFLLHMVIAIPLTLAFLRLGPNIVL